ncbi:hypothetical protein FKR81_01135 [Lentzea tibetensis]|uniref:SalK n=1 Tax=Lentzea tibetensis TaxID=2591470 RepID=A0A563F2I7_9PSEU|nr:hypothetical protein [Lentzea tibetensis]TWP54196.1 hypothetical protein FKR81_01135 [Lentzea tibetensis]
MVNVTRALWRCLEAVHGMIYFAPEAEKRYAEAGLDRASGYFASRAAALGPVSAEIVIATFYNFNPERVRAAIPAAWEKASPEQMLGMRLDSVDDALNRGLADFIGTDHMKEAAGIARKAAERATEMLHGRTLFAAHATLPWPTEPHLELWHAQTLLREFRGDGHLAALLIEGVSGLEALVIHAGSGEVPAESLRKTRGWSTEDWDATVEDLQKRGLLNEDRTLSEQGLGLRQRIEDHTDAMAAAAYDTLRDDERARLIELGTPLTMSIMAAGMIPGGRKLS